MKNGTDCIRVLVVDDHLPTRVGIAAIISAQSDMKVVGQAGTAAEAIRLFAAEQPDLTVMDLRLPDCRGVDAIRAIRATYPQARILVLTTYEWDEDIPPALEAGARGYLIKGMTHDTLVKALYRVHEGETGVRKLSTTLVLHG